MTGTPRRLLALAAVGASLALLAGCTFGAPSPKKSAIASVEIDTPEVPAGLRLPGEQVTPSSGVAPSGSRPALAAVGRQKPGKSPTVEVWSSGDGQTWKRVSGFRPPTGAAYSAASIAASSRRVAVVASSWLKGVIRPVLWTSTNGSSWTRVELPSSMGEGTRVDALAVLDDVVAVVTEDADGAASGAVLSSGKWREATLPTPGKGSILNPVGLAGTAKKAVLIARPAAEGASGEVRAYTSTDAGLRWKETGAVAGRPSSVNGVVESGGTFVVTGSTPNGDAVDRPVAWSSPDGAAWTSRELGAPTQDGSRWYSGADVRLDAPTVGADGSITALMADQDSAYATVWTRASDGGWTEVGQTGANSSNGEDGVAFAVGGGRTTVITSGDGWGRAGVFTPGWTEGTVFAGRNTEFVPDSASAFAGGIVVPASRGQFTLKPGNSWQNTTQSRLGAVSAKGALSVVAGVPEQAASLSDTVYGAAGKGGVVLGSSWDGVGPILAGGYASTDGKTWTAVTGFPGDGATEPSAVARVGDSWVALAARRGTTSASEPEHAAVFVSADGVAWTAAAGDFGSGSLGTSVEDVCEAPSGDPVAVGWVEREAGEYSPAAWSPTGGTWKRVDLGKLGSGDGYLEACAGEGSSLTVSGTIGGRSTLLSVSKKGAWTTAFTAARGDSVGRPVKVSGGFVASGDAGAGRSSQAVVWLSRTGRSWTPVAVSALQSGSTTAVAPLGDDLVVTLPPSVGGPVAIVRDIRSVIEQNAG